MSAPAIARADLDFPLGALFERQVARGPDRLAVKGRDHAFTYGALDQASNRLAHAILARRGRGSEPVAVLFAHDAPVVAAMLGVLKAGKILVALDPYHPPARQAGILTACEPGLLVCDRGNLARAREIAPAGCAVVDAEALPPDVPAHAPSVAVSPRDLATISFSSGATGDPKGVATNHRGMVHRTLLNDGTQRITGADRVGLLQSVAVIAGFRRLFGPLLSGAAVVLFDIRDESADALAAWLMAERITVCAFAASVFRHFAGRLTGAERFPSLRQVWLASESVRWSDVALFRAHFGTSCELVTGLGTSEAGTVCFLRIDDTVTPEGSAVPVGYALADKEVLILDDAGRPVERGQEGEIAVRSEFLAVGYWRRPDLDAKVFLADPDGGPLRICRTGDLGRLRPDGCLVHLGRTDSRVRLRGRFVDTGQIETALLEHPAIDGAVVSVREDRPGDQRLVAHVVPRPGATSSVGELQAFVREQLGDHYVPTAFVFLAALPRTPNGKVDRRALPAPPRGRPALSAPATAPRTPVEAAVSDIWAESLGLDEVGIHDNFLELGGTSLVAGRIAASVMGRFRLALPARALLDAPSVAQMAALVVEHLLGEMAPDAGARLLASLEADGGGPAAADRATRTRG